jgi:glycosyltransferase involved in cell wall biosynthesis
MRMRTDVADAGWRPGDAPVAVIMITLNEAHNLPAVLDDLAGFAREVFVVDSYSVDETVDIALSRGVYVAQRRFRGFGDQWNFALCALPVTAPWTMKLDPDERLSGELKREIVEALERGSCDGYAVRRRLWFMGKRLPVVQTVARIWRTGQCRFSDVTVNEHPIIDGVVGNLHAELEHRDSPDLDHWLEKQNRYTTAEAVAAHIDAPLSDAPRLTGTPLQRRMWLKSNFRRVPFRHALLFAYYWLWVGTWRAGWAGFAWARLRADVMRIIEYKMREIEITGQFPTKRHYGTGAPDGRAHQCDHAPVGELHERDDQPA